MPSLFKPAHRRTPLRTTSPKNLERTVLLYPPKPRKKRKRSRISGEFLYTRQQLEKILWNTFSTYIRARDRRCVQEGQPGHNCAGYLQAGHVIVRSFGPTKFDEWNVFAQCEAGNEEHHESKDKSLYTAWFKGRFGERRFQYLRRKSLEPWKDYSSEELKRLNSYYQHKTIELAR